MYLQALRRHFDQAQRQEQINLSELREVHKLVMKPVWDRLPDDDAGPSEGPGGFRECEIQPLRPGLQVAPAHDIRPRLDDWFKDANAGPAEGEHVLYYQARIHAAFERIHPFRDGNGRVGRLMTNLLLVRNGFPPAVIDKKARSQYLKALARADQHDPRPLAEVFARAVRHCVEGHMLPALAGPQRLVPLAALESQELTRVALRSAAKRKRLRTVLMGEQHYSKQVWVEDYKESRHQGRKAA